MWEEIEEPTRDTSRAEFLCVGLEGGKSLGCWSCLNGTKGGLSKGIEQKGRYLYEPYVEITLHTTKTSQSTQFPSLMVHIIKGCCILVSLLAV